MIKQLFKNAGFTAGLLLLTVILAGSAFNTHFFKEDLQNISNEEYYANKPEPPSTEHPFGTSQGGIDLFDLVLSQTFPTIKLALFITAGRMTISLFMGFLYGLQYRKLKWLDLFIEGFHFVPATLLAFLLLLGLNFMNFEFIMENPEFRWYFIAYTLIAIGIPTLLQLIGKETNLALHNEFIEGAKVLGGSRTHILVKHVIPSIRGKIILMFSGQLIAVLTLMMHISILGFYIPGWTAFIGSNYYELMVSPWIIFFPVLLFALLITSLTLLTNGIRTVLDGDYQKRRPTLLSSSSIRTLSIKKDLTL
ncbi:ABC transporter permease subunit [Bacillus sp. SG-1]|uniref:ABC transporter permease subunit n=1 Tax=Bacillus sp. SG-1 TaxID=161544 RepID=UPI0001543A51|nr:ABC transporter permease subunit [Bacillus sp. SG-1]EDL65878.1 possible oligopeptide transport system permease [Bacillus sp. SG-1]